MPVAHPLLSRGPARIAHGIPLLPDTDEVTFLQGRVHEASGPTRRTLALWLAARTAGPVFWIAAAWSKDRLNSDGVCQWINPARLVFVSPKRTEDLLWTMEEVLRAGAVPLSIADLPDLPSLTQVRRMHLAAEAGGRSGAHLPVGLLLTPGKGGAAGVETRWHLRPCHNGEQDSWQLERVRARTAPQKGWMIERLRKTGSLRIKSA
jgi:protein ImuA